MGNQHDLICPQCGKHTTNIPWILEHDNISPTHCNYCGEQYLLCPIDDDSVLAYFKTHNPTYQGRITGKIIYQFYIESMDQQGIISLNHDLMNQRIIDTEEQNKIIAQQRNATPHCPKCQSTNISKGQQGFKWGRAIGTAAVTGFLDVAAIAGAAGSNKIVNVCNDCGHKWG